VLLGGARATQSNRYDGKAAQIELKRKEDQLTREVERSVNRNLNDNSFAALESDEGDSSSSHSSASKKQKTNSSTPSDVQQDDSSTVHTDEEFNTTFEDDSYEQMVYNNPNSNLTPEEIKHLIDVEIEARNEMAMGKDHNQQQFDKETRERMIEDELNHASDAADINMTDKEAEVRQDKDIQLFHHIAKAKLNAAKNQHQQLNLEKKQQAIPIRTPPQHKSTYATATYNTPSPLPTVHNPYITSPKDIILRNRHLGQAIDANCYREHYTRFQITFKEPPSGLMDVEKYYLSIFTKFISVIKDKGCKQAVILPFKESNRGQGAINTKKIQVDNRLSKLNIFFDGVSKPSWKAKDADQNLPSDKYINVLIGHQETADNILVDTRSKLMEAGIKFYKKNSQAEEVYVCGWLLYSAYHMNTEEIERKLKLLLKVEVTARFRRFKNAKNMPIFQDMKNFNETNAAAMHLECEARDKATVLKYLNTFAGSNRADFVTGARVRFIEELPYFQRRDDPQYESTLAQVVAHQYKCNEGNLQFAYINGVSADVDKKFNYNITTDGKERKLKVTIRDVLFRIESHQRPNKYPRIFHAVEKTKQGRLVAFFDKGVEKEGRYLCKHLYPYLAHLHSASNIKKFFVPNHEQQYENAPWDPVSWCVKFPATDNMHMVLQDLEFGDINVDVPGQDGQEEGGSIATDHESKGMCESDIETIGGNQGDAEDEDSDDDEATSVTSEGGSKVCFDFTGMEINQPERTTPKPILRKSPKHRNKKSPKSSPTSTSTGLSLEVIELIRKNVTDVDALAVLLSQPKGGGPPKKKK
jgi:hypothetical protein